jgi:hypothetical protein
VAVDLTSQQEAIGEGVALNAHGGFGFAEECDRPASARSARG